MTRPEQMLGDSPDATRPRWAHSRIMILQPIRSTPPLGQHMWDIASVGRLLLRCAPLLAASAAGLGVPVDPRLISGLRATVDSIR